RCRFCGGKNEDLTLSDRSWVCPHCGETIEDRDLNAALNLFHYSKDWGSEASASADVEGSSGSTSDKALPDTAPMTAYRPPSRIKLFAAGMRRERWQVLRPCRRRR
ncbi:MAG: zinc ribbon domain-containing protein, partial [Sutterella sp.]|nr:zinc ribbon domain-containing protein [Sutterella sp.]